MDWTDDMIARLRELWEEGHSTAEIGRRMGVSKNGICGKAHRLHLPARPSPIPIAINKPPAPDRRLKLQSLPSLASVDTPVVVAAQAVPVPVQSDC